MKKPFILFVMLLLLVGSALAFSTLPNTGQVFKIQGISNQQTFAYESRPANLYVDLVNSGSAGSMWVECGIYKKSDISTWNIQRQFAIIGETVPNCDDLRNGGGTTANVHTQLITLSKGQSQTYQFTPQLPTINGDTSQDYAAVCTAFTKCWENPGDEVLYQTDSGKKDLKIYALSGLLVNNPTDTASCTNGKKDGLETDIDCGGPNCRACSGWAKCSDDSDCNADLVCTTSGSFDTQERCIAPGQTSQGAEICAYAVGDWSTCSSSGTQKRTIEEPDCTKTVQQQECNPTQLSSGSTGTSGSSWGLIGMVLGLIMVLGGALLIPVNMVAGFIVIGVGALFFGILRYLV